MDSTIQGNIGSEMDELQWNTVQCLLVWLARMDEVVISEKAVIVAEGRGCHPLIVIWSHLIITCICISIFISVCICICICIFFFLLFAFVFVFGRGTGATLLPPIDCDPTPLGNHLYLYFYFYFYLYSICISIWQRGRCRHPRSHIDCDLIHLSIIIW